MPAQRLRLYRNFKANDAANYYGIIRYFEQYEEALRELGESEYFDCAFTYTEALFLAGDYGRATVMFDHLLEWVITQNITQWAGGDVFAHLLLRKAAALTHQRRWPHAAHVLREYVKLYPSDRRGWRLLKKSLLQQRPPWLGRCWAVCIGTLFVALLVAAGEMFLVRPFFPDYDEIALNLHYLLLAAGLAVALAGEVWHGYRCHRSLRTFAQQIRRRRRVC